MPSEITYKDILLYKTETCRNWDERGFCRYGKRCRYAHGQLELRPVSRSSQYKTKTCKAYHEGGSCPYGVRCTFIHHPNDDKPAVVNQNKPSSAAVEDPKLTFSAGGGTTTSSCMNTAKLQASVVPNNNNDYIDLFSTSPSSTSTCATNGDSSIWDSKLGLTISSYCNPYYNNKQHQNQETADNYFKKKKHIREEERLFSDDMMKPLNSSFYRNSTSHFSLYNTTTYK